MSLFPVSRPRRLRGTPALRKLVSETSLDACDLIAPLFVKEGINSPQEIPSMPGVFQHTLDSLRKEVAQIADLGVPAVILFGIPASKDDRGSGADACDGIVQRALSEARAEVGSAVVLITDLCLDEYTEHGHCGVLTPDGRVDNDATLERYCSIAVSQGQAGADLVGPSGMMDGQVGEIRDALDDEGFADVGIMAYSAKYASCFYGPFRDAAECAPRFGDRASYQMDPANVAEAIREVAADLDEGADIVMVKPALAYLDVIRKVKDEFGAPTAAYNVSGEYAMVKAAAANGWIDHDRAVLEVLTSIRRAGADMVLTYHAVEAARLLRARR